MSGEGEQSAPPDLFIAHRGVDDAIARRFEEILKEEAPTLRAYLALTYDGDGQDWQTDNGQAQRRARATVFLLSTPKKRDPVKVSSWVKLEIQQAVELRDRGQHLIFPVSLDRARRNRKAPLDRQKLFRRVPEFSVLAVGRVRDGSDEHKLREIAREIAGILGSEPLSPRPSQSPLLPPIPRYIVATAALALCLVVAWFWSGQSDPSVPTPGGVASTDPEALDAGQRGGLMKPQSDLNPDSGDKVLVSMEESAGKQMNLSWAEVGDEEVHWGCFSDGTWTDEDGAAHFWMSTSEITVAQYRHCRHAGVCRKPTMTHKVNALCNWDAPGRENHPMNCLPREMAEDFANYVGGALPTGRQMRAAICGPGQRGHPWGGDAGPTCDRVKMHGCDPLPGVVEDAKELRAGTSPVCSRPAGNSPQGICDLFGNVDEWLSRSSAKATVKALMGGNFKDEVGNFESPVMVKELLVVGALTTTGFRVVRRAPVQDAVRP